MASYDVTWHEIVRYDITRRDIPDREGNEMKFKARQGKARREMKRKIRKEKSKESTNISKYFRALLSLQVKVEEEYSTYVHLALSTYQMQIGRQ
jgi:hypothetical protein